MFSKDVFHSVTLDKEKCKGCTNCIKKCPTEAIRVRNGRAHIISERCIDCGECIRVCPYHAKKAIVDSLSMLSEFKYNIALPAPSFYAQFKKQRDINLILTGLKKIGFDDVFEVSKAADMVTEATKRLIIDKKLKTPIISSACPAVTKLIMIRFPNLIDHVLPLHAPMELAALIARREAIKKTNLKPEEIGVFFISPCAAKATVAKSIKNKDYAVDGVLSMSDVYVKIIGVLNDIKEPETLSNSTKYGINWGMSGGETKALNNPFNIKNYISVDGINNVIKILEQLEDDKLKDILFVEGNACTNGCIGGPLTVENSFVSKTFLKQITENINDKNDAEIDIDDIFCNDTLDYLPVLRLDKDINTALEMVEKIKEIYAELPGIDCGSCGAPSCRALAEDIVLGYAQISDCIFKMRERVKMLVKEMVELEEHMPPPLRVNKENSDEDK